jgi:hypothetical protein
VLDSDASEFDGHGRVAPQQRIHVQADAHGWGEMRMYLPSRTGLVWRRAFC